MRWFELPAPHLTVNRWWNWWQTREVESQSVLRSGPALFSFYNCASGCTIYRPGLCGPHLSTVRTTENSVHVQVWWLSLWIWLSDLYEHRTQSQFKFLVQQSKILISTRFFLKQIRFGLHLVYLFLIFSLNSFVLFGFFFVIVSLLSEYLFLVFPCVRLSEKIIVSLASLGWSGPWRF